MVATSPRRSSDLLLAIASVGPPATKETTLKALSRPPLATLPARETIGSTESISRRFNWATESDGSTASARAAAPATWGVAMLVPLMKPYRLPGSVL